MSREISCDFQTKDHQLRPNLTVKESVWERVGASEIMLCFLWANWQGFSSAHRILGRNVCQGPCSLPSERVLLTSNGLYSEDAQ